ADLDINDSLRGRLEDPAAYPYVRAAARHERAAGCSIPFGLRSARSAGTVNCIRNFRPQPTAAHPAAR
ncbi:MAG: hypothetical protein ABIK83_04175, partial [Candidatus Zixiibacteriota bacterium]